MALATRSPKYTYADYVKLPDEPRVELIEGDFWVSPAPNIKHQDIIVELLTSLNSWVKKYSLGKAFAAPTDVVLSSENVVQPDILFISTSRRAIITEANVQGPPDLVMEILSPRHESRDQLTKKRLYEKFGVREYWIIDPKSKKVTVFILSGKRYKILGHHAKRSVIKSAVVSGFRIKIADLF